MTETAFQSAPALEGLARFRETAHLYERHHATGMARFAAGEMPSTVGNVDGLCAEAESAQGWLFARQEFDADLADFVDMLRGIRAVADGRVPGRVFAEVYGWWPLFD